MRQIKVDGRPWRAQESLLQQENALGRGYRTVLDELASKAAQVGEGPDRPGCENSQLPSRHTMQLHAA